MRTTLAALALAATAALTLGTAGVADARVMVGHPMPSCHGDRFRTDCLMRPAAHHKHHGHHGHRLHRLHKHLPR